MLNDSWPSLKFVIVAALQDFEFFCFTFLHNFRHLPQTYTSSICLLTCLAVFPVRFSFSLSLYRFVCIFFYICIYTHIWYTSILYVRFISLLIETEHSRWISFGQVADVCLFWQDKQLQLDVTCMQSGSQNDQPLYHRKNV